MPALRIVPVALRQANELVARWHRHHGPVPGAKFCVAVSDGMEIHGVVIVGRPVSRILDDGWTLEVNRCCTDGTPNACSMLYGAARRIARAMGFRRLITYTLPIEGGASLRGAGWNFAGECGGGTWNRRLRPRADKAPLQKKCKWEVTLQMP